MPVPGGSTALSNGSLANKLAQQDNDEQHGHQ